MNRATEPSPVPRTFFRYENALLVLLTLCGAVAALDGQALFYLSTFVADDLKLSNSQIGIVASVVLLTWSLAGYVVAAWSDRVGRRKPFLVGALIVFAVCSALSGLARSYGMLFAARLLIGFAEGPIIPLSLALMMQVSSPGRIGFNLGITQNLGAQVVGSFLAPLILVKLATMFSWHTAFYVAGLPGLLAAVAIILWVRESPAGARREETRSLPAHGSSLREMLRIRNIRLCLLVSVCVLGWYWMLLTFLPLYCVRVLHFAPSQMSYVLSISGAGTVLGSLLLPALSDRIGRRPVLVFGSLLAVLAVGVPLIVHSYSLFLTGSVFVGSLAVGVIPLFMGTVPLESLGRNAASAATGLIMGVGQVVGGFFGPSIGGVLADRYSLAVPLMVAVGAVVVAALLSLGIRETLRRSDSPVPQPAIAG